MLTDILLKISSQGSAPVSCSTPPGVCERGTRPSSRFGVLLARGAQR
ncbi:hypothetical protein ACTWPP_12690 [Actinomadura sp. 3N407]